MSQSVFSRRAFGRLFSAAALASVRTTAADADETPFDVALTSDVMVPMRDRMRLATDIYRPARNGKPVAGRFPVILERTPYGKTVVSRSERTASSLLVLKPTYSTSS